MNLKSFLNEKKISRKEIDKKIMDFFEKNPNPPDDKVHKLADELGVDPDKFEEYIYSILSKKLKKEDKIMSKLQEYLKESNKPKVLNEIFIQFGEITKTPYGKIRDAQIARLAMIAELDAANLYEAMISQTSNKDLKILLQDISNEEKTHAGEFEFILEQVDPEWENLEDEGEEEAEDKTKEK